MIFLRFHLIFCCRSLQFYCSRPISVTRQMQKLTATLTPSGNVWLTPALISWTTFRNGKLIFPAWITPSRQSLVSFYHFLQIKISRQLRKKPRNFCFRKVIDDAHQNLLPVWKSLDFNARINIKRKVASINCRAWISIQLEFYVRICSYATVSVVEKRSRFGKKIIIKIQ